MGALLLFVLSIGYGIYYEIFLRPEQQQSLIYNLDMALNMATKGDLSTASAFAGQFGNVNQSMSVQSRIPQHLALAGAMLLAPLLLEPKLPVNERIKLILSLLMVFGGILLAAGELIQTLELAELGWYISLAGYAWLGLGLLGYLVFGLIFAEVHAGQKAKRG